MEIRVKNTYTVEDETFYSEGEALRYRDKLQKEREDRYSRVSAETPPFVGVAAWAIYDEGAISVGDPPARVLKYVHGTREQAIEHALSLPAFWGYGPGSVQRIFVEDL